MEYLKPMKTPRFWNRPTTKRYGLRTDDVNRMYGNSYREYKNNKMDIQIRSQSEIPWSLSPLNQAQSFVEAKKSYDMPSSWCGQYQEPKFLTDNYISMRRPLTSRDRPLPPPRPSTNMGITPPTTDYSIRQSSYSSKYDSRYLGGVRSSNIGLSSDSYYRLEEKFTKL